MGAESKRRKNGIAFATSTDFPTTSAATVATMKLPKLTRPFRLIKDLRSRDPEAGDSGAVHAFFSDPLANSFQTFQCSLAQGFKSCPDAFDCRDNLRMDLVGWYFHDVQQVDLHSWQLGEFHASIDCGIGFH